jgi:hypothetical protein
LSADFYARFEESGLRRTGAYVLQPSKRVFLRVLWPDASLYSVCSLIEQKVSSCPTTRSSSKSREALALRWVYSANNQACLKNRRNSPFLVLTRFVQETIHDDINFMTGYFL